MVIRELTYQLHKLEASESALVSADRHDKKSVLGIGGKNPDRSIPTFCIIIISPAPNRDCATACHAKSLTAIASSARDRFLRSPVKHPQVIISR